MAVSPETLALLDAAVDEALTLRVEETTASRLVDLLRDRLSALDFAESVATIARDRFRALDCERKDEFVAPDRGGFWIHEANADEDLPQPILVHGPFATQRDAERFFVAGDLAAALSTTLEDYSGELAEEDYEALRIAAGVTDLADYVAARPGLIERRPA